MFSRDGDTANVPNFAAQVNCGSMLSRSLKTRHYFGFLVHPAVGTTAAKQSSCRKSSILPHEAIRLLCVSESSEMNDESALFLDGISSSWIHWGKIFYFYFSYDPLSYCVCAQRMVGFRCVRLSLDGFSFFLFLERVFFFCAFFFLSY